MLAYSYYTLYLCSSTNLLENMLNMVERYANNLEGLVAERTRALQAEKKRTDQLLHRMLPRFVENWDMSLEKREKKTTWFYSSLFRFCVCAYICHKL